MTPAFYYPCLWEMIYTLAEPDWSERSCCRNTSGPDLEMAVCDLSWPYSVSALEAVSMASNASVCVSVFQILSENFTTLLSQAPAAIQALVASSESHYNPAPLQNIPVSWPLSVPVSLMESYSDRWSMQTVNCPGCFVTHCLQPEAV